MKNAHHIKITVFVTPEESNKENEKKFLSLIPFDTHKEKIRLEKEKVEGLENKELEVWTLFLKKTKHTNEFLKNLASKLSSKDKEQIISQKESRLDEDVWFYLRLDKEKFFETNKLNVVDRGNCIHIKIKIAAFPKKKEIALKIVEQIFQ